MFFCRCLAFANEFWSFEVAELKARVFLSILLQIMYFYIIYSIKLVFLLAATHSYLYFSSGYLGKWYQALHLLDPDSAQAEENICYFKNTSDLSISSSRDYVWSPWISMRIVWVTKPTIQEVMANWWSRDISGVDGHTTYDPAGQFMHK